MTCVYYWVKCRQCQAVISEQAEAVVPCYLVSICSVITVYMVWVSWVSPVLHCCMELMRNLLCVRVTGSSGGVACNEFLHCCMELMLNLLCVCVTGSVWWCGM